MRRSNGSVRSFFVNLLPAVGIVLTPLCWFLSVFLASFVLPGCETILVPNEYATAVEETASTEDTQGEESQPELTEFVDEDPTPEPTSAPTAPETTDEPETSIEPTPEPTENLEESPSPELETSTQAQESPSEADESSSPEESPEESESPQESPTTEPTPENPDLDGDGVYDCDDSDPTVYTGADEICDNKDNDCDGEVDEWVFDIYSPDADGDGFGNSDPAAAIAACEPPEGYVKNIGDCDDNNAHIHPDATEICNYVDDDCDGLEDEGVQKISYPDADHDGYGTSEEFVVECHPAPGYASKDNDCDDEDPAVNPGAAEICDSIDNDCDSATDEGFDADADGQSVCQGDCDDARATVYTGAAELADGLDNDCDGVIDEGTNTFDDDKDGYTEEQGDCDDADASIYPGAADPPGDGIDSDCSEKAAPPPTP